MEPGPFGHPELNWVATQYRWQMENDALHEVRICDDVIGLLSGCGGEPKLDLVQSRLVIIEVKGGFARRKKNWVAHVSVSLSVT